MKNKKKDNIVYENEMETMESQDKSQRQSLTFYIMPLKGRIFLKVVLILIRNLKNSHVGDNILTVNFMNDIELSEDIIIRNLIDEVFDDYLELPLNKNH